MPDKKVYLCVGLNQKNPSFYGPCFTCSERNVMEGYVVGGYVVCLRILQPPPPPPEKPTFVSLTFATAWMQEAVGLVRVF